MARNRRQPRSPQRSIRGGIGRRPEPIYEGPVFPEPIVEPRVTPQGPWGMFKGGKVELFQDQLVRKFHGGKIKTKQK